MFHCTRRNLKVWHILSQSRFTRQRKNFFVSKPSVSFPTYSAEGQGQFDICFGPFFTSFPITTRIAINLCLTVDKFTIFQNKIKEKHSKTIETEIGWALRGLQFIMYYISLEEKLICDVSIVKLCNPKKRKLRTG